MRPAPAGRKGLNEMKKVTVEGMRCPHCAASVKKVLEALGTECEVDLEKKTAYVNGSAADDAIKAAVESKGFTVTAICEE